MRFLLTHSLLSSWLYAMKSSPYEDATSEKDAISDFLQVLRREPTEVTQAMRNGNEFEDLVTKIATGDDVDTDHKWYAAASKAAGKISGSSVQYKAKKDICVAGLDILLYGRLDFLKAGEIVDTKFSQTYDRGKYIDSTQHPVYMELIPEAEKFTYLVSDGTNVWTETYRRDETKPIVPIISDFLAWLTNNGYMDLYKQYWVAL